MISDPVRILLIEDSAADARLVQEMLREVADDRHELEVAGTLSQGLERLSGARPPDILLLDLDLPDAQGLTGLSRLTEVAADVPVVVLSGLGDEATVAQASTIGAEDYLIKGRFDADALGRAVRYALQRRRASAALRQSEMRYRRLHESMRDAFVLVDLSGKILETNPAYDQMLGYAPSDLSGLAYQDLTPERWHTFEARIVSEEVLPCGHSRIYEKEYKRKDGTVFPVELHTFLLRDDRGEPMGMWAIARDITERKHAEADLRLQTLLLHTQQEASIDGILVVDDGGQIVTFNQRFVEMWGLPLELIAQKGDLALSRFISDQVADPTSFLGRVQHLYEHPREVSQEEIALADGRTLDRYSAPMVGWDDHYYGRVWYYRDITERKRAEEAQARLATAVEQAAETILITDVHGSILYANPAFEQTSGYTREEAVGQNPRMLKGGTQDELFYRQMWSLLCKGEVWRGHFVNKRKDGTLYEEDATISPVRDGTGRIVNYVGVKRDVTHEVKLTQQLFQAQKMEAIGRLAGGVAHDFNNLLGIVMGYGDLVHKRLAPEDPLRAKVQQILDAAHRGSALTRQLLTFSRRQVLQPRVFDLNSVISGMETMLRRLIGEDVELTTRLGPGPSNVRADPGQIEQILMNLAANARDAMPEGGRILIETGGSDVGAPNADLQTPTPAGSYVVLRVSDTGSGMDAATQARVFEPFFTTKEVGKGTGLGLATVYGIVKQSEGHIAVRSEEGVGSTFEIHLPRVDEEAHGTPREGSSPVARGSETVLLVEDEAALRGILRETLESGGYSVLVAKDGAEAVPMAAEHAGPIQIVVTDVIMPGMSGPKLVEKLTPARPEMKVLFISGYSDESLTQHGLEGPGRAFLGKPFGPQVLLRRIRESLDGD